MNSAKARLFSLAVAGGELEVPGLRMPLATQPFGEPIDGEVGSLRAN
ncbi:hypothetical protein M2427_004502 [Bradyrhizobium sp. BR13661]|jgi:hypothetical protein|nr:hypothetical protein [Bradyrhizobium sp. BR13661]